jgi:hypothetical protein
MNNKYNNWAKKEFSEVNFGDKRLNNRVIILADRFSDSPEAPINQASFDWSETKAAYRFFNNDKISDTKIRNSHIKQTVERCSKFETILAVQDTSYISFINHKQTKGLGLINNNKGTYGNYDIKGLMMHSTLAVSTEGLPLGLLDQKIYSRKQRTKKERKLHAETYQLLPIEKKESYRWLESLKNTDNVISNSNFRVVTVCDREADMHEFFLLADHLDLPLLVRAKTDRTINRSTADSRDGVKLFEFMNNQKVVGTLNIEVPKKDGKLARKAVLQLRYSSIILNPCKNNIKLKSGLLANIKLTAIYLKEKKPPKDIEPIEWMLTTNLEVKNLEEAVEKVKWYCHRWKIEIFHKILKSGLNVESCRLATAQKLIRYLALMSIVGWRILWLTIIARTAPNTSCEIFLKESEWKLLYYRVYKKKQKFKKPPLIKDVFIWIARLGGFLARKNDGSPGITHMWRGLKRLADIIDGFEIAKVL